MLDGDDKAFKKQNWNKGQVVYHKDEHMYKSFQVPSKESGLRAVLRVRRVRTVEDMRLEWVT